MDSRFASPGDIGQFLHYGETGTDWIMQFSLRITKINVGTSE
jgi:hypothetical protein